jgi:hypothetical protein
MAFSLKRRDFKKTMGMNEITISPPPEIKSIHSILFCLLCFLSSPPPKSVLTFIYFTGVCPKYSLLGNHLKCLRKYFAFEMFEKYLGANQANRNIQS